jgi:hypothetical protein
MTPTTSKSLWPWALTLALLTLNSTMVDTFMDFLEIDFRGKSAATFTR